MLGGVQLAQYDSDPDAEGSPAVLKDAVGSFRASISLEGKPAAGAMPQEIVGKLGEFSAMQFLYDTDD